MGSAHKGVIFEGVCEGAGVVGRGERDDIAGRFSMVAELALV